MHSRYFVRTIKCNSATTSIQVYENSARNVLYKVMLELGIPVELRSLTKTTLPHSTVQVRINNSLLDAFFVIDVLTNVSSRKFTAGASTLSPCRVLSIGRL